MTYVIFHGSFGSSEGNWFPELKEQLENLGQKVYVPQFPVESWAEITAAGPDYQPQNQTLENWFKAFEPVYEAIRNDPQICMVGHSLGPVFILHVVEHFNLQLDSAIFVSPFMSSLGPETWQFEVVNKAFYKQDFNKEQLKKLIPVSYALYSKTDPYVPEAKVMEFANLLDSSLIQVTSGGHLNSEVELNQFPLVLELCKSRLNLNLYQKYLSHRRELYAIDYINKKKPEEEVIYLQPEELFDEGVFKFRNLKKNGFCTFYTKIDYWDTQSIYYRESRKAAQRIHDFSRVFIVDKIEDLKKPVLMEQINLDMQAGIKVYLVMFSAVKDVIADLYDFGIWDSEYLCSLQIEASGKIKGVRLSSKQEDIEAGKKVREEILKLATPINSAEQIEQFVQEHS